MRCLRMLCKLLFLERPVQTSTFILTSNEGTHPLLVVSKEKYLAIFFRQIYSTLSKQILRNAFRP